MNFVSQILQVPSLFAMVGGHNGRIMAVNTQQFVLVQLIEPLGKRLFLSLNTHALKSTCITQLNDGHGFSRQCAPSCIRLSCIGNNLGFDCMLLVLLSRYYNNSFYRRRNSSFTKYELFNISREKIY